MRLLWPARSSRLSHERDWGGYACCYFPAIESLALLYRATHEERYLTQARRPVRVEFAGAHLW